MIELRSDTFTKPTPGMLDAMMHAEVGDDVFGEDPTVNKLESKLAALFGMDEGVFCPSGTMANQIGIRVHTQPQDEVICDKHSHVYLYEGGVWLPIQVCCPICWMATEVELLPHKWRLLLNLKQII